MSDVYRSPLSPNEQRSELSASPVHTSPLRMRENLAGGTGVFANFFEEMAEPNDQCSFRKSDQVEKFNMSALENSREEIPYESSFQYQYRPNLDPMYAYYDQSAPYKDDEDLNILGQYKMFVNRSRNGPSFDQGQSYMTPQNDLPRWEDGPPDPAGNPGFPEYLPNEFGSDLCIAYAHRQKPPKVLAKRFLLGQTIGRGSYGKVKDSIDLITLKRHAVKVISKLGVRKIPGGWSQALLEASVMRRLPTNRHIVSLVAVLRVDNPDRLCLVMEHCLGSVHDLQAIGVPSLPGEFDEDDSDYQPIVEGQDEGTDQQTTDDPSVPGVHTEQNAYTKSGGKQTHRIRKRLFRLKYPIIATDLEQETGESTQTFMHRKVSNVEGSRRKSSALHSAQQQQQFRRLPEAQAHAYFLQLIDGLHFLHCHGVIHRDIKPANLLLTPAPGCGLSPLYSIADAMDAADSGWLDGNGGQPGFIGRSLRDLLNASRGWLVKLTDFGVSASLSAFCPNDLVSSGQTTPAVQPPEVAKGVQSVFIGTKLDVYSAGVTLYFMLTGRVPFSCGNVLQIFEAIAKGDFTIPGHVSSNAARLIRRMMTKDPIKRITLKEVGQHPWVRGDPPVPLSLSRIRSKLHSQLDHVVANTGSPSKSRGMMSWLDPLYYLRRPACEFPLPHIDDTGARIFTMSELDELLHDADDDDCNSDEPSEIAPFSVLERLELYDTLGERKEEDYEPEPITSGPPCIGQLEINAPLANFGITSYHPGNSVSPATCQTSFVGELKTRHCSGGAEYLRSPEDLPSALPYGNSGFRQRGVTISLPAHGPPDQTGSVTRYARSGSFEPMGEPPACPADLPVSPVAYFSPQPALAVCLGGTKEPTCLTNYPPNVVVDRPPPGPGPPSGFHLGSEIIDLSGEACIQGQHSTSQSPYASGVHLALDDQLTIDNPSMRASIARSGTSVNCDRLAGSVSSAGERSTAGRFTRWFSRSLSSIQRRLFRLRDRARKKQDFDAADELDSHAQDSLEISSFQTPEHRSLHESVMSDATSENRSSSQSVRKSKRSLFRRKPRHSNREGFT